MKWTYLCNFTQFTNLTRSHDLLKSHWVLLVLTWSCARSIQLITKIGHHKCILHYTIKEAANGCLPQQAPCRCNQSMRKSLFIYCWCSFWEAQQHGQKRVSKWIEKPLSPSGRNNGSYAHKINKWALSKQMDLKEPGEREIANP